MERIIRRNEWKGYERFNEVRETVSEFFGSGGSHVSHPNLGFRQIWIFSSVEFAVCTGCSLQNSRNEYYIEIQEDPPDIFFDKNFSSEPRCRNLIYINKTFAGFFCPAKESLILTDWTHDEDCVRIFRRVFPILIEKLNLKPVSETQEEIRITLGADPEFEELRSPKEYSPVPTSYKGTHEEIGCDGSGAQIEIRPRAREDEVSLVKEIEGLIQNITVPISIKGDVYPLGGHIHIGIPFEFHIESNIKILVKLLDKFLGESLIQLSGSARGDYKRLSAYEIKDWGFEYRSLPSAVFHNPEIARIVLKIAKEVIITALKRKEFEIPEKITYKEYKEWCRLTEEEYNYLKKFIKEYKKYDGLPINLNWGGKIRLHLKIYFNDDWQYPNQLLFDEELQRFKEEFFKKDIYEITLFGLKEARGEVVAGFTVEGFTTIEHPSAGRNCFGLPWSVRMKDVSREVVQKIVQAIVEKIRNS